MSRVPAAPAWLGRGIVVASAALLVVTGLAYVLVPSAALGIVGVASMPATDFLLRTEGVALLFGAAMLAVTRRAPATRGPLLALAGYYVLSSVVDAVAFAQGIVGPASVPSVIVRLLVGAVCVVLAVRVSRLPR